MGRILAFAVAVGLTVGCHGGSVSVSGDQSVVNGVGSCSGTTLAGTGAAGADCDGYASCAPVCCTCTIGTTGSQFDAAECGADGECDPADACADAQDATLCP
jgi:hypothetical protein